MTIGSALKCTCFNSSLKGRLLLLQKVVIYDRFIVFHPVAGLVPIYEGLLHDTNFPALSVIFLQVWEFSAEGLVSGRLYAVTITAVSNNVYSVPTNAQFYTSKF